MEIHCLGSTGLKVTRIGLGLAALGRPGYINLGHAEDLGYQYDVLLMQQHAHRVLDAAYRSGVRYFDAARSYGKAEVFLGSWIEARGFSTHDITVGSKWGYTYTADWQAKAEVHEVKDHSLQVLQRQWQESQVNLGKSLGLYQIHSATLESGVLDRQDVLAELLRLKHERGVKIGLSVSGKDQAQIIQRALTVEMEGERLFDVVQVTWNLLERSTSEVLKIAKQAGMGVIVKEALANGRLTPANQMPGFERQMDLLKAEAIRHGVTIDALALAAVLAQPWVDMVLSGAARLEHLLSNLSALQVKWDRQAARELSVLEETPDQYWKTRSSLPWN